DDQFVAGDLRLLVGLPDAGFVAVHGRGIDAAVPGVERGQHGTGRFGVGNLEDPEAELRHRHAVAEFDDGHAGHNGSLHLGHRVSTRSPLSKLAEVLRSSRPDTSATPPSQAPPALPRRMMLRKPWKGEPCHWTMTPSKPAHRAGGPWRRCTRGSRTGCSARSSATTNFR